MQKDGKSVIINLNKGADRAYFVFHDTITDASYMVMKDANTPFRMGVRGFKQRDLEVLYATDERYWRDNLLLHYLPGQIEYITLQNGQDPSRTFHLARNEARGFDMSIGTVPGDWFIPDATRLDQYLGYFYGVRFVGYVDPVEEKALKYEYGKEPDYVLDVTSIQGSRTTIRLFPVFTVDAEGNKKMDLNVLYAKVDDWDGMVVLKYLEIDPLLKDPVYFLGN